jgi:hypothetical protein
MKYRHRDTIEILRELAELPTDEERVEVVPVV